MLTCNHAIMPTYTHAHMHTCASRSDANTERRVHTTTTQIHKHASAQTPGGAHTQRSTQHRHPRMQACRPEDAQARRHADSQTRRHADTKTCRLADSQTRRHADSQTRRHAVAHACMHTRANAYTRKDAHAQMTCGAARIGDRQRSTCPRVWCSPVAEPAARPRVRMCAGVRARILLQRHGRARMLNSMCKSKSKSKSMHEQVYVRWRTRAVYPRTRAVCA